MNPIIPEIINFEFFSKDDDVSYILDQETFKIILDNNKF